MKKLAWYVARMADMINKNKSFPQQPEGKILPKRHRRKWKDIIKMDPKETA
jgi:hypothetical protein